MISDLTVARALSPKNLELIILPTEKCNFRCTYCYEDFAIGKMKQPIVSGIKRLLENRVPELHNLTISWFGGEPLLARDVVEDIGTFAHDLCAASNVYFDAGFTTNGYLLEPELFKSLVQISHRQYQITLDGDEEWHDKTRILANRKPTFQKIWSNLLAVKLCDGDFNITLRLHVHRDNVDSVKRLYRRLNEELLTDKRFSVYFHKVSDLKPGHTIDEGVLDRDRYLEALAFIMGNKETPKDGKAASEEHLDGYICYAAKPNSLMIRANGGIGKCTVALSDGRNDIGRINEDGSLALSNEKLQKWFSGFADRSEQTLSCPLSTLQ